MVTSAPLICSLTSQQSIGMLELAMLYPVLLRVAWFHLAITVIFPEMEPIAEMWKSQRFLNV